MRDSTEDQYIECDVCSERFWGDAGNRPGEGWVREVETAEGECETHCFSCLRGGGTV